jgi:transcription antitermination factor NusG
MPDAYWTVAKTHTQREVWAGDRLTERGVEIFLPRIATGRSIQPLFRSYIFCRIVDGRWRVIETTMGVLCLIKFGETAAARVPDREIEALRSRMDSAGVIRHSPPPPPKRAWARGDQVRVNLAGCLFDGIHSGVSLRERERILLRVLGATRSIEVARHLVAAR